VPSDVKLALCLVELEKPLLRRHVDFIPGRSTVTIDGSAIAARISSATRVHATS
jgi:hypothetical protein